MPFKPGSVAVIVAGAAASIALAPVAAAEDAAATIRDLEDQGYNVQINWVNGNSTTPLYLCYVNAIHNPDRSPGPPETFTTVYVDVHALSGTDDIGDFGIGSGF